MFNKLTWYIAYKYLISRHENGLISFIATISILGVTLGTMVLIIVLSVLNGFREHIETKLLMDNHHLEVFYHDKSDLKDKMLTLLTVDKSITEIYPVVAEHGLMKVKGDTLPVVIASDPNAPQQEGSPYEVQMAERLAQNFNLKTGDEVILAAPILKNSILGPQPRFKKFKIKGFINADSKVLSNVAISMPYDTALKFFDYPDDYITGLYLYSAKPLLAEKIKQNISKSKLFGNDVKITTWQETNQTLFQAIRMERLAITILLLIIIAVACFNILSGLFIQVSEKRKDIAILRTIGISRKHIGQIFILQAVFIAIIGGLTGIFLGAMVTYYLDSIIFWLQYFKIISAHNAFFNAISNHTIEIHLNYLEIVVVFVTSLILCLLASIIPALKSSKLVPTEALKYD